MSEPMTEIDMPTRADQRSRAPWRHREMMSLLRRSLAAIGVVTGLTLWTVGCSEDRGVAPSVQSPTVTLGTIQLSPYNAIIAVDSSLQIHVSGQTLSGDPITSFDSVVYTLQSITDTLRVQLSSGGLVTGRGNSGSTAVLVNVYAFKDNLVRASQVAIQVTPTVVPDLTLSIQPTGSDSAKLARGSSKTITPTIRNAAGDRVTGTKLRYTFHDEDVPKMGCYNPRLPAIGMFSTTQLTVATCGKTVSLNQIAAVADSGTVWVIADLVAYGVHLRDSVAYTLTYPYSVGVSLAPQNLSINGGGVTLPTVYVPPSGTVHFVNAFDPTMATTADFIFDDPSVATVADPAATYGDSTGNVIDLPGGQQESPRRFLVPGTYSYTATLHGGVPPFTGASVTGKVVVR